MVISQLILCYITSAVDTASLNDLQIYQSFTEEIIIRTW